MGFTPLFSALFQYGLVEQCLAIVQNNQAAAIEAYGDQASPYGQLDGIAGYHKGPIADPESPCLTVTAGDPVFDENSGQSVREYSVPITLHLDFRCDDLDQVADWAYHYVRLLDQIFSTVTNKGADLSAFSTTQPILWPANTGSRFTAPFAAGSVLEIFIHAHHVGLLPKDETDLPGARVSILIEFKILEV